MASGVDSARPAPPASEPVQDPLTVIGAHLSVALPDPETVRAALADLAGSLAADPDAGAAAHARLGALLRTQRNAAAPIVFEHLLAQVPVVRHGAALLAMLLRAARAELAAGALAALPGLLRSGVRADAGLAAALEELAARALPGIAGDLVEGASSALLDALVAGLGAAGRAELLAAGRPRAVRLLAARVLDAGGSLPDAALARQVLGADAWAALAPHVAYTRATHRELVELTPWPEGGCPCAASLRRAEQSVGQGELSRVLAELRWIRVVWGVEVEEVVALESGDALPLLVRPAEAELLEACHPWRRAWQGRLVTAWGDASATADAPDEGDGEADGVRRFRRYNLRHAELLAEILDVAPVTRGKVRRIIELLDEVVADYAALFAGQDADGARVGEAYAALRGPIAAAVAGGDPDQPLASDLARQVQRFEDPSALAEVTTLHGLKRYLHQRGLRNALRRFRGSGRAERTVDLVLLRAGESPVLVQRIRYAELEASGSDGRPPPAVRLLAAAFGRHLLHGGRAFPSVLLLLYGTEVQVYVQYRNHPAFLRLDLSPPRRGGMIDLEYFAVSQYELVQHPDREVPAIRALLRRLGFDVRVEGVRLHARYDKEVAADLGDLLDRAAALGALLPHLMDLDWTIGSLACPRGDRAALAEQWAELFVRLGALPVHCLVTADGRNVIERVERDALGERIVPWSPGARYSGAARAALPEGLAAALAAELDRRDLRLVTIPRAGLDGALALERAVLQPLRRALERGELVEDGGVLGPAHPATFEREHEADHLARLLLAGGARLREAAVLAARLRPLERELRPVITGSVNGWVVERALLRLAAGEVGVALLRDREGNARLATAAADCAWYRTRPDVRAAWQEGSQYPPDRLMRQLLLENVIAPDRELEPRDELDREPGLLLDRVRADAGGAGGRPRAAPRRVVGRAGSPGRATGPVRIRLSGAIASAASAVLVAPAIGAEDARLVQEAAAIVSTGGGVLSHIGLLALELGKPSLIVAGEWRAPPGGSPVLALARLGFDESEHDLGGLRVTCRTAFAEHPELLRDGDIVTVDGETGELWLLGGDRVALALHDGLRTLAGLLRDGGDTPDPLVRRGDLIRTMHQLEKLTARLDRPELACHLVFELHLGELAAAEAGLPYRQRLLAALAANVALAEVAGREQARLAGRLRDQLERAREELRRTLPVGGPLELLHLRLRERRARECLGELAVGLGVAAPEAVADDELIERLLELRRAAAAAAAASTGGWRLRHHLSRLEWLDAALPQPAPAAERELLEPLVSAADARGLARAGLALTVPGGEAGLELADAIGAKAARLGECTRVLGEEAVPPWFALTDHALRRALRGSRLPGRAAGSTLEQAIAAALGECRPRAAEDWDRLAGAVRRLWQEAPLPAAVEDAIVAEYRMLAGRGGGEPYVAVRSSAFEEDAAGEAWAGQFDTFLWLRGEGPLLEHVRLAWAGLWSARALYHRGLQGVLPPRAGGGVIVQRMVDARVAGVVHTVNAAMGRMRELVVNAALGLGVGVVGGAVGVDEIRVSRPGSAGAALQLQYRVGDKRESVRFDAGRGWGTCQQPTLFHQRWRPALEYTEVEALVAAALALEQTFGEPLDVEFAFEGHVPLVLQARPIPLFHAALRETVTRAPLQASMFPFSRS